MTEVLHAGALVPAAVGACCALTAGGARRAAGGTAAGIMLLAMVDLAFGVLDVAPVAWAALMLVAAILTAGVAGRAPSTGGRSDSARRMARRMALYSSAGLVVTASLVLAGMGPASAPSAEHGHSVGAVAPIAVAAGVGYAVASWAMAARIFRSGPAVGVAGLVSAVELASMGASMALMAVAAL